MKNINIPYILLIVLLVVSIVSFKAAHNGINSKELNAAKDNLIEAKSVTLEILDAMPAEFYSFQPNEEVLAFMDQVHFLVHDINALALSLQSSEDWNGDHRYFQNKKELVDWTSRSFDLLLNAAMDKGAEANTIAELNRFLVENAKHNGQLQLYLSMKGIKVDLAR